MSKLEWYTFEPPNRFSKMQDLIKWLPEHVKIQYYTVRLCCIDMYLPKELWQIILWYVCESKTTKNDIITKHDILLTSETKKENVEPQDVLKWYDNYITNPEIHCLNPVLLASTVMTNIFYLDMNIGINHSCYLYSLNSEEGQFNLTRIGDLFLGIVKDPNIKSFEFNIKNSTNINYKVNVKDLYEYTFNNVYSHPLTVINDMRFDSMHIDLYDPIYKLSNTKENSESLTFWSFRDIMPISLINAPYTITSIKLETIVSVPKLNLGSEPFSEPINSPHAANLNILYGHLNTDYRVKMAECQ